MMRQLLIQRNGQFEMVLRHESLLIHICKFESDPFVSHVCEGNRMWTQQTGVWPPLKTVAYVHRWEAGWQKQRIVCTHRERRVNMALYITYSSTQEELTKSTQLTVSEIPKLCWRRESGNITLNIYRKMTICIKTTVHYLFDLALW